MTCTCRIVVEELLLKFLFLHAQFYETINYDMFLMKEESIFRSLLWCFGGCIGW